MRLINTKTLQLEEFFEFDRPPYAILSHTWGRDEVSFQEWMEWQEGSPSQRARVEGKLGFRKICNFCHIARGESHDFVWVDTNCIDKKSSAELSEAINSMFAWYHDSAMCFVYLEDYLDAPKDDIPKDAFGTCRWFTRGWTLQELLAPYSMRFYNKSWECIGSKHQLIRPLRSATGINQGILTGRDDLRNICVAQKMSWASRRQTTRAEDTAYCLLGLFSINMPLLYGEGGDAFRRLQEEIMKVSTDQSIFAWDWSDSSNGYGRHHWVSMLAPHPLAFQSCFNIDSRTTWDNEFMMTNRGLTITLPLLSTQHRSLIYGVLDCYRNTPDGFIVVCIPLLVGWSGMYSRPNDKFLGRLWLPAGFVDSSPTTIRVPRLSQDYAQIIRQPHWRSAFEAGERAVLHLFHRDAKKLWEHHGARDSHPYGRRGNHSMATVHSVGEGRNGRHIRGLCVRPQLGGLKTRTALVVLWSQDFFWTQVLFALYEDFCRPGDDDVDGSISRRVLAHAWATLRSCPSSVQASQSEVGIRICFSGLSRNGFGDVVFPVQCTGSIDIDHANGLNLSNPNDDTSVAMKMDSTPNMRYGHKIPDAGASFWNVSLESSQPQDGAAG